jgi:hypothetical protein
MPGAAESPLGDREGGATAIFEKSGPPDSADLADFCNKIGPKPKLTPAVSMSAFKGGVEAPSYCCDGSLLTRSGNLPRLRRIDFMRKPAQQRDHLSLSCTAGFRAHGSFAYPRTLAA